MRKTLAFILALALCFGITACAEQAQAEETLHTEEIVTQAPTPPSTEEIATQAPTSLPTEETEPVTYTYKAEPMQNASCFYYGPGTNVPSYLDPGRVREKIMVWTQCPNCGEENNNSFIIDPAELDFSMGDTIMYSDTDSCWDCSWDKGIERFMWTIRITRIPE